MFTGIIEGVGTVGEVVPEGDGVEIQVRADFAAELAPGESVAVDGACQTVTHNDAEAFRVQAVATTLGRTTFGAFRPGRRVNLERAVPLGGRLGGHLVQGHVDGVGRVLRIRPEGELTLIDLALPEMVAAVTVLHGSLALNGISLTVNALPEPGVAQVSIIPFTWTHTALPELREGDTVNLEGDLVGKYVRQLLGAPAAAADLRRGWGY